MSTTELDSPRTYTPNGYSDSENSKCKVGKKTLIAVVSAMTFICVLCLVGTVVIGSLHSWKYLNDNEPATNNNDPVVGSQPPQATLSQSLEIDENTYNEEDTIAAVAESLGLDPSLITIESESKRQVSNATTVIIVITVPEGLADKIKEAVQAMKNDTSALKAALERRGIDTSSMSLPGELISNVTQPIDTLYVPMDTYTALMAEFKNLKEKVEKIAERGPVTGPRGPQGPKGEQGAAGKKGECVGFLAGNLIPVGGKIFKWGGHVVSGGTVLDFPTYDAKVGDILRFTAKGGSEDLHQIFSMDDYTNCIRNTSNSVLLAANTAIRGNKFYDHVITEQDVANSPLMFAALGTGNNPDNTQCKTRKVKTLVNVSPRTQVAIAGGDDDLAANSETVQKLQGVVTKLSQTLILTQLAIEKLVSSKGDSGITITRGVLQGMKSYKDGSWGTSSLLNIHNHNNYRDLIGMGEISAALNGVEFQTRHNDYKLVTPCNGTSQYHCTKVIDYPDVPPEVLNAGNIDQQIAEMQEWFRAFKDQDYSVRDYRPYFRPVLSYLEGTWVTSDLKEPFASDRHFIDAKNWKDLYDKTTYLHNSGHKDRRENVPYLPASIRGLVNDTDPIVANWEYRIVTVPLREDIPTNKLRVAQDLARQLLENVPRTLNQLKLSRSARFELNRAAHRNGSVKFTSTFDESRHHWDYLDYIMEQVPGKDNAGAFIADSYGEFATLHPRTNQPLNAAYYNRYYRSLQNDAMGAPIFARGFHDMNLFVARTTQDKVSSNSMLDDSCDPIADPDECSNSTFGPVRTTKWSYAIPLEIIYTTPLTNWNPYDLPTRTQNEVKRGQNQTRSGEGATANGCGPDTVDAALNGTNPSNFYYRTPVNFYAEFADRDPADTGNVGGLCVLDKNGQPQHVESSGHWITTRPIGGGVGQIRQRYPIAPVHVSGSATWKELEALKQVVFASYPTYETDPTGVFGASERTHGIELTIVGGGHDHTMFISAEQVRAWWNNKSIPFKVTSSTANGHEHIVEITRSRPAENAPWEYKIELCSFSFPGSENQVGGCADGHTAIQTV